MQLEVTGFVLNELPYGETSKIINILTEDKGIIGVICKGAKSLKSQLRVGTMPFTYGKFYLLYKENKLSTLTNVDIINPLKNIREDLIRISYVTYLSELTTQVVKENPKCNIYDNFINTIFKIEDGLDPMTLSNILELKYLPLLGVGLNLDSCIKCGNKTEIVTIDASFGGLICKHCYTNEPIVDSKIIKLIRMYYYVDIKSVTTINVKDEYRKTINKFINDYFDSFTGIYVYSKKFLEKI